MPDNNRFEILVLENIYAKTFFLFLYASGRSKTNGVTPAVPINYDKMTRKSFGVNFCTAKL